MMNKKYSVPWVKQNSTLENNRKFQYFPNSRRHRNQRATTREMLNKDLIEQIFAGLAWHG